MGETRGEGLNKHRHQRNELKNKNVDIFPGIIPPILGATEQINLVVGQPGGGGLIFLKLGAELPRLLTFQLAVDIIEITEIK